MVKRLFDLGVTTVSLIVLAPLLAIIALLVELDSPGPVLYRAIRIGLGGRPFRMYKFRTMVVDADRLGPALTAGEDPRVTRAGRVLRHWKLDELPQLLNVLLGQMSLVGPRPEAPCYVQHYSADQRRVLQVRPGITGPSQIRYRHEESLLGECSDPEGEYVRRIMPEKLAIDLKYIESRSLVLDLKLIARTGLCVFARDEMP